MASDVRGIETLVRLQAATDDKVARGEIVAVLANSLTYRDRSEETASLLELSLRELDGAEPRLEMRLRAELLEQSMWGTRSLLDGVPERVDEAWPGESYEARKLLDTSSFLEAHGLGRIDRAERLARGAIHDADTIREDARHGPPPTRAMIALVLADRGDEVEPLYPAAVEAARTRNVNAVAAVFGTRSYCRTLDGDIVPSLADAERAADLARPVATTTFAAIWTAALAWAMTDRGDLDAARELMLRELPPGVPSPPFFGALTHRVRARLHSALGEHEAAGFLAVAAADRMAAVRKSRHRRLARRARPHRNGAGNGKEAADWRQRRAAGRPGAGAGGSGCPMPPRALSREPVVSRSCASQSRPSPARGPA